MTNDGCIPGAHTKKLTADETRFITTVYTAVVADDAARPAGTWNALLDECNKRARHAAPDIFGPSKERWESGVPRDLIELAILDFNPSARTAWTEVLVAVRPGKGHVRRSSRRTDAAGRSDLVTPVSDAYNALSPGGQSAMIEQTTRELAVMKRIKRAKETAQGNSPNKTPRAATSAGAAYSPVSGGLYRARTPAVDSADRAAREEHIARAKASSRACRALNLAKKEENKL